MTWLSIKLHLLIVIDNLSPCKGTVFHIGSGKNNNDNNNNNYNSNNNNKNSKNKKGTLKNVKMYNRNKKYY